MSELDLEKRARQMAGETLRRVLYQWPPRLEPEDRDRRGTEPHTVGLAVHLETDSGRRFRVGWADEFGLRHGHGVSVAEAKVIDTDAGAIQDVSDSDAWRSAIGCEIADASIHWASIQDAIRDSLSIMVAIHADHLTRSDYPQSLQLDFVGHDTVFVSAARLRDDGLAARFTNNLLVIFRKDDLERLGLVVRSRIR